MRFQLIAIGAYLVAVLVALPRLIDAAQAGMMDLLGMAIVVFLFAGPMAALAAVVVFLVLRTLFTGPRREGE
jgi:K+-sensing histidine kinase KdpD